MSTQQQDVFSRCLRIAQELGHEGRTADGVAVLYALRQYLLIDPAFPDGSCVAMVSRRLLLMRYYT